MVVVGLRLRLRLRLRGCAGGLSDEAIDVVGVGVGLAEAARAARTRGLGSGGGASNLKRDLAGEAQQQGTLHHYFQIRSVNICVFVSDYGGSGERGCSLYY